LNYFDLSLTILTPANQCFPSKWSPWDSTAKPMIVPPFKAFLEVHCLKFCNCVPWFCLNYLFFLCLNLWSLISTSVINFWVSITSLLTVLAYVHMILLLLFTQPVRHEFGGKVTHFQIVFQNVLNWYKLISQHVSSFVDGNFFVFKDKLLYLVHISFWCALWWMSWVFDICNWGHTPVDLG